MSEREQSGANIAYLAASSVQPNMVYSFKSHSKLLFIFWAFLYCWKEIKTFTDWNRARVLWYRKQQLGQLCHNEVLLPLSTAFWIPRTPPLKMLPRWTHGNDRTAAVLKLCFVASKLSVKVSQENHPPPLLLRNAKIFTYLVRIQSLHKRFAMTDQWKIENGVTVNFWFCQLECFVFQNVHFIIASSRYAKLSSN